jgi:hypothetical protein
MQLAVAWESAGDVIAEVTRRRRALDPLLPDPVAPLADCGAGLVVTGAGTQPTAVGICEHWEGRPDDLDLAWGAARRFQLTALTAGSRMGAALDQLLALWREHLAGLPAADDEDSAAVVTWPCRDIDGIAALVHHGLAPFGVIAARTTGGRAVHSGLASAAGTEDERPLSVPFWSQQGYRPLWTSWEIRPAGSLR